MSAVAGMKRRAKGSAGFTLAEILVAVGILTLLTGLTGDAIFQTFSLQRTWRDDVSATRDLRHAGSWFAGDALNAETTDLVDGSPPVDHVSLSWTGSDGAYHTATYNLSGGVLSREFDGNVSDTARGAVSVGFSLSGSVLTLTLAVEAEQGTIRSISQRTYLRALQ